MILIICRLNSTKYEFYKKVFSNYKGFGIIIDYI